MKTVTTASFTELPFVLEYARVRADLEEAFASHLGVPASAVRETLMNRRLVLERLRKASGAELALLELLVDCGGRAPVSTLRDLAHQKLGWEPEKTSGVIAAIMLRAFLVPLRQNWDEEVAILDLCAHAIASTIRGVTLPEELPAETPSSNARNEKVAIMASTAHLPVRVNQNHQINRVSLRKLATMLRRDPELVERTLVTGARDKMLEVIGDVLRPSAGRLMALARAANPIARALPPGWVPRERVVRAIANHLTRQNRSHGVLHRAGVLLEMAESELETIEHAGNLYVRRGEGFIPDSGDGHVTPSFEVMLGPQADPEIVAAIALAAAPVRLDRVLTFKLGRESIMSALACGLSLAVIERALAKVSSRPVPENVSVMVRDWASSTKIARHRPVIMMECSSPETADLAANALGQRVLARPSPTLLLLAHTLEDFTQLLREANVHVFPIEEGPVSASPAGELEGFVLPELTTDGELRRKYAEDLRAGLPPPKQAPRFLSEAFEEMASSATPSEKAFLSLAISAAKEADDEIERWCRAHGLHTMSPLDFVPVLALKPSVRKGLLKRSRSLEDLAEGLRELYLPTAMSPRGAELLRRLQDPSRARPEPADLSPQPPKEVRQRFATAAERGESVWLRVKSKQGDRVIGVDPERVLARGNDVALLGMDSETEANRSFPLASVLAVMTR